MTLLEHEVIDSENPNTIVIWLHGLGADGFDFIPIVKELTSSNVKKIKFYFPHAPIIPITINNNMKMRAWYDIYNIDIDRKIDENGILKSVEQIKYFIDHIRVKYPQQKIILAGFSQGGVIALSFLKTYSELISGVIALSCYLPNDEKFSKNLNFPIFMAHGEYDSIIPLELALKSKELLMQSKIDIKWFKYTMAHQVCEEEINDISNYLDEIIDG